jgi:hypothetical protein
MKLLLVTETARPSTCCLLSVMAGLLVTSFSLSAAANLSRVSDQLLWVEAKVALEGDIDPNLAEMQAVLTAGKTLNQYIVDQSEKRCPSVVANRDVGQQKNTVPVRVIKNQRDRDDDGAALHLYIISVQTSDIDAAAERACLASNH